jgi:hypothetical protein
VIQCLQMALRIDRGELRPVERLADGRVRLDGRLTRTGVFEYLNSDGSIRREYRSPEEVFNADSLRSFVQVPVTNDHPPQHLDSKIAKSYTVGMTGENVVKDGDHVRASLCIYDAETVAALDAGKVELSCGYMVDVIHTPGITPTGEKYDAIQRNIRGNHVAIVDTGRAGPTARVRMDGDTECAIMVKPATRTDEVNPMDELQKLLASALATNAAEKTRADKAEADLVEVTKRALVAEQSAASEKARADKAEAERADALNAEPAKIRARVQLETKAASYLGEAFKADASDRDLMVAVIKKVDSFDVPADAKDDAVALLYTIACNRAGEASEALGALRVAASNSDAGQDAERAAADRQRERSSAAWKELK